MLLVVLISCWCIYLSSRLLISLARPFASLPGFYMPGRPCELQQPCLCIDLHCHGVAVGRLLVGLGLPRPALLGFGRSD